MEIREARPEDSREMARVSIASWRYAYSGIIDDDILSRLDHTARSDGWRRVIQGNGKVFVGVHNDQLIGLAHATPYRGQETELTGAGEITAIYLQPEHIGLGFGKPLFTRTLNCLKIQALEPIVLWVLEKNERAIHFYRAMGLNWDGGAKVNQRTGLVEHRYRLQDQIPATLP